MGGGGPLKIWFRQLCTNYWAFYINHWTSARYLEIEQVKHDEIDSYENCYKNFHENYLEKVKNNRDSYFKIISLVLRYHHGHLLLGPYLMCGNVLDASQVMFKESIFTSRFVRFTEHHMLRIHWVGPLNLWIIALRHLRAFWFVRKVGICKFSKYSKCKKIFDTRNNYTISLEVLLYLEMPWSSVCSHASMIKTQGWGG